MSCQTVPAVLLPAGDADRPLSYRSVLTETAFAVGGVPTGFVDAVHAAVVGAQLHVLGMFAAVGAAVSVESEMVVDGIETEKERKSVAVDLVFEGAVSTAENVPGWDH